MTTMLAEVVVVVKEMSRDVQFIKSELADARFTPGGHRGPAPGTTLEMTPIDLPIMNKDNFNEAESSLKNESVCQSMIARLALVGGTSSDSMIRRMLSPALTNSLACHFNWAGKGNKQPFSRTVMQGCMFAAARQFDRKLSYLDLSNTVKKWLRCAPEREPPPSHVPPNVILFVKPFRDLGMTDLVV
ncbi:uncharacterized protein LOC144462710 [Epinephelus lanceolatus]